MTYSGFKLLRVNINNGGRSYLPDDKILSGKKIQAIVPVADIIPPINNYYESIYEYISFTADIYLNLTSNGQYYEYRNTLVAMLNTLREGEYDQINRVLSFPDCYIEMPYNPAKTGQYVVCLGVFFEDKAAYDNISSNESLFSTVNIDMRDKQQFRYYFTDDRTLVNAKYRNFLANFPTIVPNGNPGVNRDDILKVGYITLCRGGHVIWEQMPVVLLYQLYNYKKLQFADIQFDLENSYLELSDVNSKTLKFPSTLNFTVEYTY